jgi:hypothetical protein
LENVVVDHDLGNIRFDNQIEIEGAEDGPLSQCHEIIYTRRSLGGQGRSFDHLRPSGHIRLVQDLSEREAQDRRELKMHGLLLGLLRRAVAAK